MRPLARQSLKRNAAPLPRFGGDLPSPPNHLNFLTNPLDATRFPGSVFGGRPVPSPLAH
jgi:hypothetical protein